MIITRSIEAHLSLIGEMFNRVNLNICCLKNVPKLATENALPVEGCRKAKPC